MSTSSQQRAFDIVVFGATGFTGRLVAEYLRDDADPNTRWAIAGRDPDKLAGLHRELQLPTSVKCLTASSDDRAALAMLAGSTNVVCTTVGPYAKLGEPLLRACAEAGTHYCDLAGEVQWMADVYEDINPIAEASGAQLVHCCGFDSIPFDLGVWFAQQTMQARFGVFANRVRGRMGKSRGSLSGGTAASMMLMLEQASRDPAVRQRVLDPYCLYPPGLAPGVDGPDQITPKYDRVFKRWTAPFLMAPCNTRVIRRSNALDGFPYGADFGYEESLLCSGRGQALAITGAMGGFMATAWLAPGRSLLTRFLPKPGEGPDDKARERGFFEYFVHAHHPEHSEQDLRIKVTGRRDPGYGATSRMLAQSALSLAHDKRKKRGGILTPATAMGQSLIDRLRKVDVTFEVLENSQ